MCVSYDLRDLPVDGHTLHQSLSKINSREVEYKDLDERTKV